MLDADAAVPDELVHPEFVVQQLTADLAELDFESYKASPDVISIHSDGRWPVTGFSLSDELAQVSQHQADHDARRAFTFALLSPNRQKALGCLYVNPLREFLDRAGVAEDTMKCVPPASAMVTFWIRQDKQDSGLADVVVTAVDEWLRCGWPLEFYLFRVLPEEVTSRDALANAGLRPAALSLTHEPRPYLWFAAAEETQTGEAASAAT